MTLTKSVPIKKAVVSTGLTILILLFLIPPAVAATPPFVILFSPFYNGLCASVNGVTGPTTPGATIVGFSWNWGDGSTSAGGFIQTHAYASAGSFLLTVTVTDSNGLTNSAGETLTVPGSPSPPTLSIAPALVTGLTVSVGGVTNQNQCGSGTSSISFNWGDGTTSQSFFAATHTYSSSGIFNICVTSTDATGLATTQCESAQVGTVFVPEFPLGFIPLLFVTLPVILLLKKRLKPLS